MSNQGNWLNLAGKTCVVVGGARGIGAGVSEELLKAGAKIAILARNIEGGEAICAKLDPMGENSICISTDITQKDSLERAAEQISAKLGPVYGMVNCVGIMGPAALQDVSQEEWQRIMDTNVTGALFCMQVFSKDMIEAGIGSIVQLASIAAHTPQTYSGAYSASKVALEMLSRQTAAELGEFGIRSNVVCPGMTRTPLTESFYAKPEIGERRKELTASQEIGTPEDMANAVLFLLSERAKYINGAQLVVDGGFETMPMENIPRPGYGDLRDQVRERLKG